MEPSGRLLSMNIHSSGCPKEVRGRKTTNLVPPLQDLFRQGPDHISQDATCWSSRRIGPNNAEVITGHPAMGGALDRDWMSTPLPSGCEVDEAQPRFQSHKAGTVFYFQPSGSATSLVPSPRALSGPAPFTPAAAKLRRLDNRYPVDRTVLGGAVRRRERLGPGARGARLKWE